MRRPLAALALAALLTTAGCGFGGPADSTTVPTTETTPSTTTGTPSTTTTATATDTTTPTATTTETTTRDGTAAATIRTGGFTDAPPSGRAAAPDDLAALPRLYRRHYRAVGNRSVRLTATITAIRNGSTAAWLTVTARRTPSAALDRTRLVERVDDPLGNGTVASLELRATYRRPGGPDLFYRRDDLDNETVERVAGTAQGVPLDRALSYTVPWGYRDLVVRLAAAGDYGDGERVTVDGEVLTRYRAASVDRAAFEALGIGDRPSGLWLVAGDVPYGASPVPEDYRSTVFVGDDGLVRRVNLTLSGPRRNRSLESVPTTVRVRARFAPMDATTRPPRWVRRTPRLRVERLAVDGLALAVEHGGGPAVRVDGSVETGTRTSRTVFPMLPTGSLGPGESLYVYLEPDDDGNRVELATSLDRPEGPFVDRPLRALSLSSTPVDPAHPRLELEHLVGVERATNGTGTG